MDSETLYSGAEAATWYAHKAWQRRGKFLGETEDFWRGAASTYRLLAKEVKEEEDARE